MARREIRAIRGPGPPRATPHQETTRAETSNKEGTSGSFAENNVALSYGSDHRLDRSGLGHPASGRTARPPTHQRVLKNCFSLPRMSAHVPPKPITCHGGGVTHGTAPSLAMTSGTHATCHGRHLPFGFRCGNSQGELNNSRHGAGHEKRKRDKKDKKARARQRKTNERARAPPGPRRILSHVSIPPPREPSHHAPRGRRGGRARSREILRCDPSQAGPSIDRKHSRYHNRTSGHKSYTIYTPTPFERTLSARFPEPRVSQPPRPHGARHTASADAEPDAIGALGMIKSTDTDVSISIPARKHCGANSPASHRSGLKTPIDSRSARRASATRLAVVPGSRCDDTRLPLINLDPAGGLLLHLRRYPPLLTPLPSRPPPSTPRRALGWLVAGQDM
ncbi:hypothetical protein C7M84_004514 [Penaeus vannamei]|uniref:Uncharacterized protein n=1 Tax=Penaeus vannamei TaxID=6689 RepID=A0A3R7PTU1_PENVA|nr:hypothetical protein C7M84_004514 [Penaeus vannamei]